MRRSLASMLVIGLLAALLASCGQSVTVQQTGATPTTTSNAHTDRIAWQGFLYTQQALLRHLLTPLLSRTSLCQIFGSTMMNL